MKLCQHLRNGLHTLWHHRAAALAAAVIVMLTTAAATGHASALYILTGAEETAIILDGSTRVSGVSTTMLNLSNGSSASDMILTQGQTVTIRRDNKITMTESKSESVSALLNRLGLRISPLEMVAVDVSGTQVEITIDEEIIYYDRISEPASFGTVRVPNPDMMVGMEQVAREGVDGFRTAIYEVVWANGEEVSRQLVEQLDSTAIDEIVEYGTAPATQERFSHVETNEDGSGTLYFPSGATLEFTQARPMTATAYTAGHDGADYCTATGTHVRTGTVAVDKRVIPLGTEMYIITDDGIVYGVSTAEDTGVRGEKVDLYFHSYDECINFGRRACTVYILK